MKKLLTLLLVILFIQTSNAQINDKNQNTIEVLGSSKMIIVPDDYKAQIFIQEEEQKVNYQTIGKSSIDSIKISLFKSLKKYNIDEKDLKLVGMSSQALGQYPYFLNNLSYEFSIKNKERGKEIVSELRLPGLKGILIRGQFSNAAQSIQETLYDAALNDAKRTAVLFTNKVNKTLGEVRSIQMVDRQIPALGRDMESYGLYNTYNLAKFEMDFKDVTATCNIRVTYDLK